MCVEGAIRTKQARLSGGQLTTTVDHLAFCAYPRHLGSDGAHQVHAQFGRRVATTWGIMVWMAQPSAESSIVACHQPPSFP